MQPTFYDPAPHRGSVAELDQRLSRLERLVERLLQAQKNWAERELEIVRGELDYIEQERIRAKASEMSGNYVAQAGLDSKLRSE